MNDNTEIITKIESLPASSAWARGVKSYAINLVVDCDIELTPENALKTLLNGARDWIDYSLIGNGLVYNCMIARALCTPCEFQKSNNGTIPPNRRKTWGEVEATALIQAFSIIQLALKTVKPITRTQNYETRIKSAH